MLSRKYHQEHPTISFRCRSIAEYDAIKQMVGLSGKSESTFIRELLLDAERQESQSYDSGYYQGFNKFSLPCLFCGKTMIFDINDEPEVKQKIQDTFGRYMHTSCMKVREEQRQAEQEIKSEGNIFKKSPFYF